MRLSTKLDNVVRAANALRNRCTNLATSIQAAKNGLPPHALKELYAQCGNINANVVPLKDDAALATYADQQFSAPVGLGTLLPQIGGALNAVAAEIESLTSPYKPGEFEGNNGLSVVVVVDEKGNRSQQVVPPIPQEKLATLLGLLQGIAAGIPE